MPFLVFVLSFTLSRHVMKCCFSTHNPPPVDMHYDTHPLCKSAINSIAQALDHAVLSMLQGPLTPLQSHPSADCFGPYCLFSYSLASIQDSFLTTSVIQISVKTSSLACISHRTTADDPSTSIVTALALLLLCAA